MSSMSKNLSFTVELEQGNRSPGTLNSEEHEETRSSSHSQAWEINFASGSDQNAAKDGAKRPSLPKFLRDRERNRSHSTELLKSSSQPSRSSSSPLKAKDPKPIARPPSKSTTSPPRHSNSSYRLGFSGSVSPKKSPTIKKPLLPVTSPTRKSRTADLKSRSECSLTLGTGTNGRSGTKMTRPHSAMPSLGLAWQESIDGHAVMDASDEGIGRLKQNGAERPAINVEVPRASKSLPIVTLGNTEGSSSHSKLAATPEEMAERKVLDLKRWYCVSHPQYSMSCGISSVVSCWNYLFSTLGNGSLPPLTQEEALTLLGFKPPFGKIKFGPFTGNITCMRWFQRLCGHFGVPGQAYYFYKPVGRRRTSGVNPSMALDMLQEGLQSENMAFVYHCSNHYFCPIGYEQVPRKATDAYRIGLRPDEVDTWVLIGDPSRTQSAILSVKWANIVKDLTCVSPKHFNIRHVSRGIVTRNTKCGGNRHCIMAMKKVEESILATLPYRLGSHTGADEYDGEEVSDSEVEELESSDSDYPDEPNQQTDASSLDLLENIDLENVNLSSIYSHPSHHEVRDSAQEAVGSALRRSGTFTKDGPTVQVKLTRQPSSESEFSVDDSGIVDWEDNPPELLLPVAGANSGVTPNADSASGLRRSGTFTKDTATVCVQRSRAWSSEDDSDTSLNAESNATRSSHDDELWEGVPRVSGAAAHSRREERNAVDQIAPTSEQAHFDLAEGSEAAVMYSAANIDDDDASGSEDSPLKSSGHRRRIGTYTEEEPSLVGGPDVDLDSTLKASDYTRDPNDSVDGKI